MSDNLPPKTHQFDDRAALVRMKEAIDSSVVSVPFLKRFLATFGDELGPDSSLGTIVNQYVVSDARKPNDYMQLAAYFSDMSGSFLRKEPEKTAMAIEELRAAYGEEIDFHPLPRAKGYAMNGAVGPRGKDFG